MRVLQVENLIDNQSQKHKERLLSQFSRLTDSAPSFPDYYSIDGINSSVELGTRDLMTYVGPESPVRFKEIIGMPVYGISPITTEITFDNAVGAYTDFSATDGLVLNSVIKPYPGDHFILKEFNPEVIFVVTEVHIRAIRGDDHYIIDYAVVPASRILDIRRQIVETYRTNFRNIGTEDKVLIKQEDYNLLNNYMDSYNRIHERYIDENFNKEFGYLTTPEELSPSIGLGTCKYLIKFLMTNRIIYFDEILETVFAFESVLPFEARHNKLYSRTFILHPFLKKSVPVEDLYVDFKGLPVSLFKAVSNTLLGQSIEFVHVSEEDSPTYEPSYNGIKIYDTTFTSKMISKDYTELTAIQLVVAKFVNNEDITIDEFNEVIEDYDSSDIFRFYFLPLVMMILKISIKALQTTYK